MPNVDAAPGQHPLPQGLSQREALQRLTLDGYNELPSTRSRSTWRIALEVVREPMFLLLVSCAGIYLLLGDIREAWVLIAFVGVVLGITIVQERRTERALEALRDLSSPRALVIRDGERMRIPGREVVRGDLLLLHEGDRIAADGVVLQASALSVDESFLTGESVPVRKLEWDGRQETGRPGGDDLPFVYSGSLVVQGQALAQAHATGVRTELGKIGRTLGQIDAGKTGLEDDTDLLVKRISLVALGVCALAALIYGATRGNWLGGMLAGIAIAMSLLPEEFPVVLTVFLAFGAWRMSQHRVLTRRMPAVEALGAATVLCVDKTGTLTENRMRVARLANAQGEVWDNTQERKTGLPEPYHRVVEFAQLATRPDPFDPMEQAIAELAAKTVAGTEHMHTDWSLTQEYPLSPQLLSMAQVWRRTDGDEFAVAAKGAPEAIVDLCHLDPQTQSRVMRQVGELADDGLRVIAVAAARFPAASLPKHQHDFAFQFMGLVALADPVRAGVAEAIRECYAAGMRVVMITGDLPRTAISIASNIGLPDAYRCLTGEELDRLSGAEFGERLRETSVIARAVPEQKLRIVRALQAQGEVVAMTGDGVNDAPALKAADIGVAMGGRGSDVARESASLVVLDDDFGSIVRAVRMGRRIYDNLRKAVSYIIAVHLPIAGVALLPIFFGWPVALLPVHIAFLELIIDPACSIAFEAEPEEADIMRRPPRNPNVSLYSGRAVRFGLLEGATIMIFTLAVYLFSLWRGYAEYEMRSLTFTTLVLGNLALIITSRSHGRSFLYSMRNRNAVVWWIVAGTLCALTAVLALPALRDLFKLAPLSWPLLGSCAATGLVALLTLAVVRQLVYGRARQ